MATTPSPHIGILIPDVGSPGPLYATNIVNAFLAVDAHNHTETNNKVPTAGISIDADLNFVSNGLLGVKNIQLDLNGTSIIRGLWVDAAGELNYTSNSNQTLAITSNGSINISNTGAIVGLVDNASLTFTTANDTFTFFNTAGSGAAKIVVEDVTIQTSTGSATISNPASITTAIALPSVSGTLATTAELAAQKDVAEVLTNKTLTTPSINGGIRNGGTIMSNTLTDNIKSENNIQTAPNGGGGMDSVTFDNTTTGTQKINFGNDFTLVASALQSGQEIKLLLSNTDSVTRTVTFDGILIEGGTTTSTLEVLGSENVFVRIDRLDTIGLGAVVAKASPTPSSKANSAVYGTFTWVAPTGVTQITMTAAGAGGGGGNFSFGNNVSTNRACSGGGGGGGAAWLFEESMTIIPGQTYTFVCADGTSTAAGADTTISGQINGSSTVIVSLDGGKVGGDGFTADDNTTGGAGGVAGASETAGGETTDAGAAGGAGGGTTSGSASGQNGIVGGDTTVNSLTVSGGTAGAGGAARRRGGGGGGGASLLGGGAGGPGDQNATAGNSGGGGGGGGFLVGTTGGTGSRGSGGAGGFSFSYLVPIGSTDNPLVGP